MGADTAEIKADYPDLTDTDIQAAIAYAADHIDREGNQPVPDNRRVSQRHVRS